MPVRDQLSDKKVAIVVLNYKNSNDTIECLHSLNKITYQNTETIVVDNNSQDDSLACIHQVLIERKVSNIVITESSINTSDKILETTILLQALSNRGYAAGNNLGVRVALARGADYVLILNNDTIVKDDFLEPLIQYSESNTKVGLVGPKVVDEQGNIDLGCARRRPFLLEYFFRIGLGCKILPNNHWIRRHTYKGEYGFDYPREVDIISGCCMLIKKDVFCRIGLLDENTFLYLEEFIIHEKLRNVGLVSAVIPASIIVHKKGRSTAKASCNFINNTARSSLRYYLMQYRHCGRFVTAAIILSTCMPKAFFGKIKASQIST